MKRLLIVEDDPHTLSGLKELLSDEGYKVIGVMNGNDALDVAASEPFDMVLCDYDLPDINGLQVCEEIKRMNPDIITFIITAYFNKKLTIMANRCGVMKVFPKPIILDELFKTLFIFSSQLNFNYRYSSYCQARA